MPEKISIVKESGETINSNIVSLFKIPDTGKKYIITTENAVDPHGLTVLHVSEIVDDSLQKIATDDEWSTIKTIMRAIISGNVVSYKYLPPITSAKASSQYSRDISVSASASKQMVDNYNAADKSDDANAAPSTTSNSTNVDNNSNPVIPPTGSENQPPQTVSPQEAAPAPVSIFPTNDSQSNGDELIPGISEVSNQPANTIPDANPVPPISQEQSNIATTNIPPVQDNNNIINPAAPIPSSENQTPIGMPTESGLMQNNMSQFAPNMPMQQMMGEGNQFFQPQMGEMPPLSGMSFNNEVQVVDPNQIVPTGQIIQDAVSQFNGMNMNPVNMNPSITPSFNPNATLDEVVLASQEMFMEGVKNLIQTIQEKVYRDLYAKEAALKAREELIIQKEQMLSMNPAMMSFNTNSIVNSGIIPNNMMMQQPMSNQLNNQFQQVPNGFNASSNLAPMQQPINQMNQLPQMGTMIQNQVMPNGPITVSTSNDIV